MSKTGSVIWRLQKLKPTKEGRALNKSLVDMEIDGRMFPMAFRSHIELRISDEHGYEVGYVEVRRQPDNELSVTIYKGAEEDYHVLLRPSRKRT